MDSARQPLAAQAQALAERGRVADAYALLSSEAAARDAAALATLAHWRLSGQLVRRDLGEARRLFGLAAELGDAQAESIYTAMLANGAGCERRWSEALGRLHARSGSDPGARRELDLIAAMGLDKSGEGTSVPAGVRVSDSPRVERFSGLLSEAECRWVIERALPLFQPAVVIDPQTGRFVRDPVRNSDSTGFPFISESPALHAINRRIARAAGVEPEQGEPVQVLRYGPGQEYKPHSDALGHVANQRILTFLVYLNDDYEGGETHFLKTDLKVRGRRGDAILFRNVTDDGRPDPRAIHAGLPVRRGRKLLLSKWIREKPLDLSGPPGRPF